MERKIDIKEKALPMSIHALKNILGNANHSKLLQDGKVVPQEGITQLGIDLSDMELKIVEGILKAFAETQNKGNLPPMSLEEIQRGFVGKELPKTFDNIKQLPRIHLTQKKLFSLAGIKENSIADKQRAVEALLNISQKKYQIYYNRLAQNELGKPTRNKFGVWEKEFVVGVGTLFNIYHIFSEKSKQLRYYEIHPNPAFLDQIENYFVLIPYEWREEVKRLAGGKRISLSIYLFLLYLRYQYEIRRRGNWSGLNNKLSENWFKIAQAIRVSETDLEEHKGRARATLIRAYELAKTLGYIVDYEISDTVDVLTFNTQKYLPTPKKVVSSMTNADIGELFNFFYSERKKIDINCDIPSEGRKNPQLLAIGNILKHHSKQTFRDVVVWGLTHPYWRKKISSPNQLKYHFSSILNAMGLDSSENLEERNKEYVKNISKSARNSNPNIRLEILNSKVEIIHGVHSHVISYKANNFIYELKTLLKKLGFTWTNV